MSPSLQTARPPAPPPLRLAPPALGDDEAHVWCFRLEASPGRVAELAGVLSPAERERAARFRSPAARHEFVVCRGLLRLLLGRYLDHDPAGLRFGTGGSGKPFLAGGPAGVLRFNVAHSHGVALIGVTRGDEIGVDVERLRPFPNDLSMAERYFSPREADVLRVLHGPERTLAFFQAWTRKEAFLKAHGQGLAYGLERVEVTMQPGEPALFLSIDGDPRRAGGWSLHHLAPQAGYVGAVALPRAAPRIVCVQGVTE